MGAMGTCPKTAIMATTSAGPAPLPMSSVRLNSAKAVPLVSGVHTFYAFQSAHPYMYTCRNLISTIAWIASIISSHLRGLIYNDFTRTHIHAYMCMCVCVSKRCAKH
jgi:hypothetical protein